MAVEDKRKPTSRQSTSTAKAKIDNALPQRATEAVAEECRRTNDGHAHLAEDRELSSQLRPGEELLVANRLKELFTELSL